MVLARSMALALFGTALLVGCTGSDQTNPKITSFTCTPTVPVGSAVTLTWQVSGALSLAIEPVVGTVNPPSNGSTTVTPTNSTTFTLTASGLNGSTSTTCFVAVTFPPTINIFTATPNQLDAGGGPVVLAWDVTGATALSIDQGVGPVTPLDAGTKLLLVGLTKTFTLTATNATGDAGATAEVFVAPPPPTQPVNGFVVDIAGQPIAGETVLISATAFSASAVTDSNGAFSVSDVPTPYDATIVDATQAIQYQGLTRSDPSLTDFVFVADNRSAVFSGSFVGGNFPEPSGYKTEFVFTSSQTTQNLLDQPSGSFSSTITWPGPTTTTGAAYALQIHSVSGLPADYPGYGSLSGLVLQDTGSLAGQNVSLSAVPSGSLSGTVNVPTGYTVFSKSIALQVASDTTLNIFDDVNPAASFTYVTPAVANTTLLVAVAATSTSGEFSAVLKAGQSANGTGIVLAIPAAPTLSSPANAATGVAAGATPFSWSLYSGGVYEFAASSSSGPTFVVLTAATTVTIPDLSSAGLALPPATAYSWSITGLAPVSSIDLLAAAGGINKLTLDLSESDSASQTFTTAP